MFQLVQSYVFNWSVVVSYHKSHSVGFAGAELLDTGILFAVQLDILSALSLLLESIFSCITTQALQLYVLNTALVVSYHIIPVAGLLGAVVHLLIKLSV